MDVTNVSDKRTKIMAITWNYMLKNGLGSSYIGELCRDTGLSQSSLYHWFANKDDIWISAGKYGLSKVVEALLAFTFDYIHNPKEYFETLLDEVEKYKSELRLAVQMVTSPAFGARMRLKANDFRMLYEKYACQFIEIFNCSYIEAETFIYSIIAYVIDYAIWDDKEKTQMLLDNLYQRVMCKIEGEAGK